ncbi:choice-of-anchor A domain-containing protein [Undibacterium pigrum]|uniref:Choice-of-anchor A domain-containing protein n=2 Tax=Undibacterium pigrum TaxID=401470 RepID=A0A318J5K4_9BURK|nr:choice-of-anchor A domain-containing protein [Undibacterium pigrum]
MDTTQKNYQGMSLIVGNQLTFNGGSTHGKATYGSSKNVNNLQQGDTVVKAAPPFSFADNKTQLTDLSTNLAAQTANGKTSIQFNGMTFQGDGTSGTQIFNVKGTDLLNVTYANFVNLTPGQTLIINVSGDSGMQGGMPDGFRNYNTLFNFSTAKKLTFTNVALNASILAPLATVSGGSGVVDGKVDSNLATVSLTVTAVAPPALTSADLGLAGQFNAFIFNDYTATGGEVAGTMAVGRNFNVSAFSMDTTQKNYQGMSLIVGNQLTFNGGSTHGKATYGSSKNVNNLQQGDTVVKAAPPFSFADNKTQLTDLSTNLAAQTANGKTSIQFNGMTFQGDGTSGTQIFNVKGADLLNVTYANFVNLTPGQTLIINVTGDSGMQGGMPDGFRNYNTLFNFSTAKKLTFTNVALNASILAPLATVSGGSGVVDGNVVVNNWNSNVYIANNRSFQAAGMPTKPAQSQSSAMGMSVAAANPYATAVSPATPATTNSKTTSLTATPMQATSGSSAIVIPAASSSSASTAAKSSANTTATAAAVTDGDLAMAALLDSLGNSLGSALQAQMDKTLRQQ